MSFRLVPKSVTLNDLERHNGRYIALFHWIWYTCVVTHNIVDLWRNLCTSLLYFAVRVRCRIKVHVRYLISWWVSCITTTTTTTSTTTIASCSCNSSSCRRETKSVVEVLDDSAAWSRVMTRSSGGSGGSSIVEVVLVVTVLILLLLLIPILHYCHYCH